MKTTTKKHIAILLAAVMGFTLAACQVDSREAAKKRVQNPRDMDTLTFVSEKWDFDEQHRVFYQQDVSYATDPETDDGRMQIYIPGRYYDGKDMGEGKFSVDVNEENYMGVYQAKDAPIMIRCEDERVDDNGNEKETLYSYDRIATYLENGIIVVTLPKEATALEVKAAIRSLRYNLKEGEDKLPGNSDNIFVVGGTSAAIVGESANSSDSFDEFKNMGAIMRYSDRDYISDQVMGVLCSEGCYVEGVSQASSAWGFGQYDEKIASDQIKGSAKSYAGYVNELALKDEGKNDLALEESEKGVYTSGSYYDMAAIQAESALNTFLSNIQFPYKTPGKTYESPQAYVDSIKGGKDWVTYDKESKSAHIKDFESFAKYGPHDAIESLYGVDKLDTKKVYADKNDPLYYTSAAYKGNDSSDICKYWKIAMDVNDCSRFLPTMNMYLALRSKDGVMAEILPFWYEGNVGSQGTCDWINTCVSTEAANGKE